MVSVEPEDAGHRALFHQQWRDVCFVHWPVPAERVDELLPDGLRADIYEGSAWVTITPFAVCREHPAGLPPLPVASNYGEVNLRTYVVGPKDRDGIWFFSLDVSNPLSALAARAALRVPYHLSHVAVTRDGGTVSYRGHRRATRATMFDIEVTPAEPMARPTARDTWLTGRWRAWTAIAGRLLYVPVTHEPWPLHSARVERCTQTLTDAARVPGPTTECLVHYAPGVDARFGQPAFPASRAA